MHEEEQPPAAVEPAGQCMQLVYFVGSFFFNLQGIFIPAFSGCPIMALFFFLTQLVMFPAGLKAYALANISVPAFGAIT